MINLSAKFKANVFIRDAHTQELLWQGCNMTVDGGLTLALQNLFNVSGYTGLNYCAIGTGTTAPAHGDTQLGTETARNQFTSDVVIIGSQATIQTFFLASQCTVRIRELGLFGNGATSTANSGTLFARVLCDFDNSTLAKDIVVTWIVSMINTDNAVENLLSNPSFESGDPPDNWLVGNTATLSRDSTTYKVGSYSGKVVKSGAWGAFVQHISTDYLGKTVLLAAWGKTSTASAGRLLIYTGSTNVYGDFIAGDGAWHYTTVSATLASSGSPDAYLVSETGDAVNWDNALLIQVD